MIRTKAPGGGLPGWLVMSLLGLAVIALLYATWGRLRPTASGGEPPVAGIVVRYEGHNWIPVDPGLATRLPDADMVMVGLDGRLTLWANRARGLGGGGGSGAPKGLETGAYHRIYVRLEDGRYLPMMWLSDAPGRR